MNEIEFIRKIGPAASECMRKTGVLASLVIAQAALESSWGKSAPGNMLFGVKAGASWKGKKQLLWTHEYDGGKKTRVQAYFRAYDSWLDSLLDHAALITGNKRYKAVVGEKEYQKACRAIQAAGYATDPKYADKLIGLIEKYELHKFDQEGGEPSLEPATVKVGEQKISDGFILEGRVYVPARDVAQAYGKRVDWDNKNKVCVLEK